MSSSSLLSSFSSLRSFVFFFESTRTTQHARHSMLIKVGNLAKLYFTDQKLADGIPRTSYENTMLMTFLLEGRL